MLRADGASVPGRVKPGLATFVRAVWQRVGEQLTDRSAAPRTVLFLHDADLIARYWDEGGHAFLTGFQHTARGPDEAPHGLWLLCPVEPRVQRPHLDGRTVEVIGGDGEQVYLKGEFLGALTGDEAPEAAGA